MGKAWCFLRLEQWRLRRIYLITKFLIWMILYINRYICNMLNCIFSSSFLKYELLLDWLTDRQMSYIYMIYLMTSYKIYLFEWYGMGVSWNTVNKDSRIRKISCKFILTFSISPLSLDGHAPFLGLRKKNHDVI